MSVFDSMLKNGAPTNHDLATLADWADEMDRVTPNPDWKKGFRLLRRGADILLRRRARSTVVANED